MESNFGLANLKMEGRPAHPDDVYIHCGCEKCEERWQLQLAAYEKAVKELDNNRM